ncbi:MAG: cytidylate kinase-like family protein [Elusimicrobiota bacterium]|jgi:cytidylate kinase|nr:cytidylate kinase-like family protein [Elusimicrobiota bacterium]
MNGNFAITIARQYGSGGFFIGREVAKILQIQFYDKELLEIASKKSGIEKDFFEQSDEITKISVSGVFQDGIAGAFGSDYNISHSMFEIQSNIIKILARKSSAVFVGRAADYVLRNNPNLLTVFVCASIEDRKQRVSSKENFGENKATSVIEKTDKQRSRYYNFYTGKPWNLPSSYHICVNTSFINLHLAAKFISDVAKEKFNLAK